MAHPTRRSLGIQVRGVEVIRWVQVHSPRGVRSSPRPDLSPRTCSMGEGHRLSSAGLVGSILLCTCPGSAARRRRQAQTPERA